MASVIAVIFVLIVEAALLSIVVILALSAQRARKRAAPYYPAPGRVIRIALEAANIHAGESFYDLGAGTGTTLLIAEREFGAYATGFEISLLPYWIGRINLFVHGSHAILVPTDFFDANLAHADVIFCFLATRTMQKMEERIKAKAKPGARIIVYAFPFPTMIPTKTVAIHGKWKIFIYKIEK